MRRVLSLFGTRPEIIKLAPVLRELERRGDRFESVHVASSQHTDLLHPFASYFGVRIDHDLGVMEAGQTPTQVAARTDRALRCYFSGDYDRAAGFARPGGFVPAMTPVVAEEGAAAMLPESQSPPEPESEEELELIVEEGC